ncbi:MAG: hypothetical protein IJI12_09675 [Atopobiaceae bacterium]|nr:hypothetical protein [Atopobiaceae bacterium]
MMRVLAIDPGMKHTGVALVDERGVVRACTLDSTKYKPVKTSRPAMIERGKNLCTQLGTLLTCWEHDVVVVEQFDLHFNDDGTPRKGISNAMSATQGIWFEGWLLHYLCVDMEEDVHPQTPTEVFSPRLTYSIWWYLGANKPRGLEKEDELRYLARHMPGGENCHGARDQIQAAAHGIKYILDHERLFD